MPVQGCTFPFLKVTEYSLLLKKYTSFEIGAIASVTIRARFLIQANFDPLCQKHQRPARCCPQPTAMGNTYVSMASRE